MSPKIYFLIAAIYVARFLPANIIMLRVRMVMCFAALAIVLSDAVHEQFVGVWMVSGFVALALMCQLMYMMTVSMPTLTQPILL